MRAISTDVAAWEKAQAEYKNPLGDNASARSLNATAAVQRMYDIEARWESAPGGFAAARERYGENIKRIVDSWPPLTPAQRERVALLLLSAVDATYVV